MAAAETSPLIRQDVKKIADAGVIFIPIFPNHYRNTRANHSKVVLLQKGLTNQPLVKSYWNHTNMGWQAAHCSPVTTSICSSSERQSTENRNETCNASTFDTRSMTDHACVAQGLLFWGYSAATNLSSYHPR
ncbi:MAG TPA: hypothetical protein DEF45_12590 [Rhodopirellula sp.]|nr:hypothetical protein [Rhodopirellula sp.]